MPGVFFDFTRGIGDAIDYLGKQRKCRRIGFIGHIEAWINPGMLQKFHAYLHAVQRYMQMDRALIEGCWPKPGNGRTAVRNLLARTRPDALLVASDLLIPEIAAELEAQGTVSRWSAATASGSRKFRTTTGRSARRGANAAAAPPGCCSTQWTANSPEKSAATRSRPNSVETADKCLISFGLY